MITLSEFKNLDYIKNFNINHYKISVRIFKPKLIEFLKEQLNVSLNVYNEEQHTRYENRINELSSNFDEDTCDKLCLLLSNINKDDIFYTSLYVYIVNAISYDDIFDLLEMNLVEFDLNSNEIILEMSDI